MAAVIGALRVTLGADTGSFEDGLKKASSSLSSFASNITTIASGITLAKAFDKVIKAAGDMAFAVFDSIDAMDKMGKEAQKLGTSVEGLSKLSVAAKLADIDTVQLSRSVITLSKNLVNVSDDAAAPATRSLNALGISAQNFRKVKLEDQLALLADRFTKFRDGTEKTAAAAAIFGQRVGPQLIPLLNEGAEGIRKAAERAQQLNLIFGEESADAAQKFNDNMKLVGLGLTQGIFNALAEKILPTLVIFSEKILDLTVSLFKWAGISKDLGKEIEDLRKKMSLPTDEEARKAKMLEDKLLAVVVQTRALRGDFSQLAPGLVEAGISLGVIKKNAETLPATFGELSKGAQRLNFELFNLKAAQITQENLLPLDAYKMKLAELQLVYRTTTMDAETFARASLKIAESFGLGWQQIGTSIAGTAGAISQLTGTFAKENKAMGIASKAFGIGQAIINTQIAITKALATLPPPASYAAVAFAVAQGAASIAAITAQQFAMGGKFRVGGAGGMDSQLVQFMASPDERVTVEPQGRDMRGGGGGEVTIKGIRPRDMFTGEMFRELVDALNAGHGDGYRLRVA